MKLSDLPTMLRELADALERLNINGERGVDFNLYAFGIDDRDELRKWAALMGDAPELDTSNSALTSYSQRALCGRMVAFFKPGLLGGKVRQVIDDDDAGLAKLLNQDYPSEQQHLRAISAEQPQWAK